MKVGLLSLLMGCLDFSCYHYSCPCSCQHKLCSVIYVRRDDTKKIETEREREKERELLSKFKSGRKWKKCNCLHYLCRKNNTGGKHEREKEYIDLFLFSVPFISGLFPFLPSGFLLSLHQVKTG